MIRLPRTVSLAKNLREREANMFATTTARPKQLVPLMIATAEHIRDLAPWQHYFTTTFHHDVSWDRARAAHTEFVRNIAQKVALSHVEYVVALERTDAGRLHGHGLLRARDRDLTSEQIRRMWPHGLARVRRHGAEGLDRVMYATKFGDFDVDVACDRRNRCRRNAGCRDRRMPWT